MGGGSRKGVLAIVDQLRFFARRSVVARELLLDSDTSLAIATSGWRTNLLLQEPLPKPPIRSSRPKVTFQP